MQQRILIASVFGLAASAFAMSAGAQNLGALAGGVNASSLMPGSAGNAAGLLQFCISNNYLSGNSATSMRDQLIGKIGGADAANSDSGYTSGAQGLVTGQSGNGVDITKLGSLEDNLTQKACGTILQNASSLL